MKAKIVVIGDMLLVAGMRLAGIENCWPATETNVQRLIEEALAQQEFGILIINEYLLNKIDWRLRKKLDKIAYPVIIPMPEYSGVSTEGEEIRQMIKRALGFDLEKK
jgi:vacuolar-type H+-ATPase subunit F/Vma7